MEDKITKRDFKRDVILIMIGALLASIPTLISTYMQTESQLHQIILDRRIIALKDYSEAYNKLVSDIIPQAELLESQLLYIYENELKGKKVEKEKQIEIMTNMERLRYTHQNWITNINTQTLVINSLYDTDLSLYEILYLDPLRSTDENLTSIELAEKMQDDMIKYKKTIVDQMNAAQKVMRQFALLIKQY
jgi:hypothetical protein